MGNSQWYHVVPYQEDISQALRELQVFIFSIGRFFKGYNYADDEWPSSLEEVRRRSHGRTHSVLDIDYVVSPLCKEPDQEPLFPLPKRVPQLLPLVVGLEDAVLRDMKYLDNLLDAPEGTQLVHGFGIYPLPPTLLRRVFGTERPTRYQVLEAIDQGDLDHYGCMYIVIFDNEGWPDADSEGPPDILFYGWTGGGP